MIRISRFYRADKPGPLKAFFDVEVPGNIVIKGFRLIKQEGSNPWVSVPVDEYTDAEGRKSYAPRVVLPSHLKKEIDEAIFAEFLPESGGPR